MGQEITTQSDQIKQPLSLLTKILTPQELQSHGDNVGLRLEIASRKYDRFGWDQISQEIRALLRADWIGKLLDYGIDEIDAAISEYVDDVKNKKAPHEGQIKMIIIKNRAKAFAALPKSVEITSQRQEPNAASKARVQEMVNGLASKLTMKTQQVVK